MTFLALGSLFLGCGEDHDLCPELCERSAECPAVLGSEDECTSRCTSELTTAEETGCEEQWETKAECESHSTNLCDEAALREECSVQFDAYESCKG
jgi:hypothetical protein